MRMILDETEVEGPNMTPVIDIVFLLLIFFLVATQFEQQEKLVSIRLAEILQASPLSVGTQEVVVNVTKEGQFIVIDQTLSETNLIDFLHAAAVKNPSRQRVQIRADQEVILRYPMTVVGICVKENLEYSMTVMEKKS